jgi:hypothetical protein
VQREDDVPKFEDPALRSAIRKVWAGQTAPAELHRRLVEKSTPSRARWYRHPLFSLAAAAIVLVAVGLLTLKFALRPAPIPAAESIPEDLAINLALRHDACCRAPDHHMPGLPRNDLQKIAVILHGQLGFAIMSGQPSAAPWRFDGAAICDVGHTSGAHLIFKQANQDISVFSLPISVDPQAAGKGEFTAVEDGHPIAGFATKDALYAVVGSSTDNSLSLATVTAMCDRLRPTVAPAAQPAVASIGW